MTSLQKPYRLLIRQMGSLKMAVILIFTLALVLAAGTFCESYYSREYAYNLVYGSLWFQFLLLFLAFNILAAALVRLPYKKMLSGFYLSHIGLLLLLGGSLLTLLYGIDGELTLPPRQYNKVVRLSEPVFYVEAAEKSQQNALPVGVFAKHLDQPIKVAGYDNLSLRLKRFLPYARESIGYEKLPVGAAAGLEVRLFAPQAIEKVVLSSPPSQFPEQTQLGPLHLQLLGNLPDTCVLPAAAPRQKWFFVGPEGCAFFDAVLDKPTAIGAALRFTALRLIAGTDVLALEGSGADAHHLFIPQVSPWPLSERKDPVFGKDIRPYFSAPYRLYATERLYAGNALVFLTRGKKLSAFLLNPPEGGKEIPLDPLSTDDLELPWMKLRLRVEQFRSDAFPVRQYLPTTPNPGDKEKTSALAVEANGFLYWLASGQEFTKIPVGDGRAVNVFLGYRTFDLPWNFRLERFKMDRDPGTENPASYESFVNVQQPGFETLENAHVYMNNPLKKGKYTFYQASYFPAGPDQFGSVLQVNYDPGRWVKYAGSLILIAGTILHFYLRRVRREAALEA